MHPKLSTIVSIAAIAALPTIGQAEDTDIVEFPGSVYPVEYLNAHLKEPLVVTSLKTDISAADADEKEEPIPSNGETVKDAIETALRFNPQVEISKSQVDAAAADQFAAFGQFLPDIEVTAAHTDDSWRSSSLQTLQDRDGTTFGVTAVQPISQGLATFNRYRSARARMNQADFAFLSVRQQVAFSAARAHANVVLAREIVEHRINNLALLNRQFEIVSKRADAGAQGRTGVEQARVRRAQAQVDLGTARASLAQSEAAYQRTTGRETPAQFQADNDDRDHTTSTLDKSIQLARDTNPDVNASKASLKAAEYAKGAALGDFAPKITLEGSYFRRFGADQTLTQEDDEYQLVARLRLPIFNQGRNIADLRSARASTRQARAELNSTRLAIDEIVMRSWRQLVEAENKRIAAKQGIEAAEQSVKGLQMEYEAGQRTVIDVLDGQRDLVQAQISLSQAEFDVRVSRYELFAATGSILDAFDLKSE